MLLKHLTGPAWRFKRLSTMSLFWMALGGCQASNGDRVASPAGYQPRIASLALTGYNYTDQEINEFFVNGRGGGNLRVSSPGSGGGGTVCCTPYVVGHTAWTVTVRWQSGGCNYHVRSTISDEVYDRIHWFFKEARVRVDTPEIQDPKYLEIHFYPDGGVQAAVTGHASGPRLELQKQREKRSPFPRCPDDKKPAN